MIKHKKRLAPGAVHRFKNRPLLWDEKMRQAKDDVAQPRLVMKKQAGGKKDARGDQQWKVSLVHVYSLRFDSSISNLNKSIWVDGQTVNYFNAQRDNIFASSSKYDIVQFKRSGQAA